MSNRLAKMLENKLNNVQSNKKNNYLDSLSSTLNSVSEKIDKFGDKIHTYKQSLYDNNDKKRYIRYFIVLFLSVYGGLAVNNLPESIAKLFENELFKFAYLILLIGVFFQKEWTIAILLSVIFLLSIRALSIVRINKVVEDSVNYLSFKKQYMNTSNLNTQYTLNDKKNEKNENKENKENKENEENNSIDNNLLINDKYASFN